MNAVCFDLRYEQAQTVVAATARFSFFPFSVKNDSGRIFLDLCPGFGHGEYGIVASVRQRSHWVDRYERP